MEIGTTIKIEVVPDDTAYPSNLDTELQPTTVKTEPGFSAIDGGNQEETILPDNVNASIKTEAPRLFVQAWAHEPSDKEPSDKEPSDKESSPELVVSRKLDKFHDFVNIPDKVVPPRARAVIPNQLIWKKNAVYTNQHSFPTKSCFGPVEGIYKNVSIQKSKRLAQEAAAKNEPVFFVTNDDGTITHIDTSDQDKSNWISLLEMGNKDTTDNMLWLCQNENKLYAVSLASLSRLKPLKLGYSKEYADVYGIPDDQPILDLDGLKDLKTTSSSEDSNLDTEMEDDTPKTVNINVPEKSRERYLKAYESFIEWKKNKKAKSFSESLLLKYFEELSRKLKPSSLWAHYSMLNATLFTKHHVDIKDFARLNSFLKKLSNGFQSNKSGVLSVENVERFIAEAPDNKYLATKVALIFGVHGGCRSRELTDMTIDNIENHNQMLLVKVPETKTTNRAFVVRDKYLNVVQRYLALRPHNATSNRFFLNYQDGKCTKQNMGKNKIAGFAKEIATYLKLPEPEGYTGHCFRRTSTKFFSEDGARTLNQMRSS